MKCGEIFRHIENWAPAGAAWQKDNVGLQIGSAKRNVKNILLCLELTESVLREAIKKECNLIITHHPLIFHPIKKLDFNGNRDSLMIEMLIKNDITLFSAHTNLDFTKDGVSFEMAKLLGLKNINFLENLSDNQLKISVFVPAAQQEKVADAIFSAGGGTIGEYRNCSFRTSGIGTFKGTAKSNPALGEKNKLEKVEEIKLEIIINSWDLAAAVKALIAAHPYEEPAFDIYPLANNNVNYGIGAIGEFDQALSRAELFKLISQKLKAKNFRFSDDGKRYKIKTVAVCGGSGADYMKAALQKGADAYITADVKYHNFHDAAEKILLIDAGHYETEIHSLYEVKKRIEKFLGKNSGIKVSNFSGSTNPVNFYNN
jgi:dinuclear metal center YbgI/SA1388 family protein